MTKNNWLIPVLIIIGAICVILSVFIGYKTETNSITSRHIATIELNMGRVDLLRSGLTRREILNQRNFIYKLDTIETAVDGDATLSFESGYKVRIPENSSITLDQSGSKTTIIIKRGDINVESMGKSGAILVSRDGVRWNLNDYEQNYKSMAENSELPDLSNPEPTSLTNAPKATSPIIDATMRTHRNPFFKCYTQLLQKDATLTGHASLTFTVEKNGRIYKAHVADTNIKDPQFSNCLVDAVKRIEFKGLDGESFTTTYPFKFE